MFEYHNQNFNTPKQTTISDQLKSLGDKFRKVANLGKENTLTLNDMDGLMDHVQIPTNPNMFKNTKDFAGIYDKNIPNSWSARGGNGLTFLDDEGKTALNVPDVVKTKVVHLYATGNNSPKKLGLQYNGHISLVKDKVYTVSYMLRYNPYNNGNATVVYPFSLYGAYTSNFTGGSPLVQIDNIVGGWYQYCLSFKAPADSRSNDDNTWWFESYTDQSYPGGSLYIANIKMEEGDLATPWCE